MKTDAQLVGMALKMAAEDKNSVVMFALPSYIAAREFFSAALSSEERVDGVFKHQSLDVTFPSGGRVMFRWLTQDNMGDWGGYQYSHAFVPRRLGSQCDDIVRSKLRYPISRPPKEPSGIFRPYWVERLSYYEKDLEA